MKKRKYKIKCKNCDVILETEVPTPNEIKCQCGNIAIYSDYIAYGKKNNLSSKECYEDLSEPLTKEEVEEFLREIDNESI